MEDQMLPLILGSLTAVAYLALATNVWARDMNMRVFEINDHLISFYDGRPPPKPHPPGVRNWVDYGAMDVGVSTHVIHQGDQALVYDTFPTVEQAKWVRDYLEKRGIKKFTVVSSHWHLDHNGGNAVYSDVNRIATNLTIERLTEKKEKIEAGKEWGPPPINPLAIANVGIDSNTNYYVGTIKVELRPVNIHSADGLVIYIPNDRFLLAGDTLEDTVTFIAEPELVVEQYRNMLKYKQWDITKIFPNHGDPDVISHGGYNATLIDATTSYLRKVIMRAHDPDYLKGSLEDYVGDSVQKGWISIWEEYREPHEVNLKRVQATMKDKPLPQLSD
jgi:cyclase